MTQETYITDGREVEITPIPTIPTREYHNLTQEIVDEFLLDISYKNTEKRDIVFRTNKQGYIELDKVFMRNLGFDEEFIEQRAEMGLRDLPEGVYTFKNGLLIERS